MSSLNWNQNRLLTEGNCLHYDGIPCSEILHFKSVYTIQLFRVSTNCRHKDLVVYYMTWLKVSTLWCHQKVDIVSTLWQHTSFFCCDLSTFWWHKIMSSFYSDTKCLLYAALPNRASKTKCQHSSSLISSIKKRNFVFFERDSLPKAKIWIRDLSHHRPALILMSYREMIERCGFISQSIDLVCNLFDRRLPGRSNFTFLFFYLN